MATIDASGTGAIYKNGRLIFSANVGVPNNVARTKNYLAKSDWSGNAFYAGGMQDAAIYAQALSAAQIQRHYDLAIARGAFLDRGNGSTGSYGIELQNANNVTLSNLNITGAYDAIHTTSTNSSNASSHLTVTNSSLFANADAGINIDSYSDHATLGNDQAWGLPGGATTSDDQAWGIYVLGPSASINSRTAHDGTNTGIYAMGDGSVLTANTAYNDGTGINLGNNSSTGANSTAPATSSTGNNTGLYAGYGVLGGATMTVSGNTAHDNKTYGLDIGESTLVTANTAYNQTTLNAVGIHLGVYSYLATQNVVYNNYNGLVSEIRGGIMSNNRVFANSNIGIWAQDGPVRGNQVYCNATGISAGGYYGGEISNNLVYANSSAGIVAGDGTSPTRCVKILNNTVYQLVGDALRVAAGSTNIRPRTTSSRPTPVMP